MCLLLPIAAFAALPSLQTEGYKAEQKDRQRIKAENVKLRRKEEEMREQVALLEEQVSKSALEGKSWSCLAENDAGQKGWGSLAPALEGHKEVLLTSSLSPSETCIESHSPDVWMLSPNCIHPLGEQQDPRVSWENPVHAQVLCSCFV